MSLASRPVAVVVSSPLLALLALLALACSSSGGAAPAPVAASEDAGPAPGAADASTADAGDPSCQVGEVPSSVRATFGLSAFYTKHLDVSGFPILSSPKVPDRALCVARDVVTNMLAHRPELFARLVENKIRLALMAESELTTDIPEHSDLTPKDYWDQRARGLGATFARPAVSGAEENVLCYTTDRYKGESILVHEFAHAVFDMAIATFEPTMATRLKAAYDDAIAKGLYKDTYAATNESEYWAEGVQDWFDTNLSATPADGVHNEIDTRAELKTYDPALAELVSEVFGDRAWRYACPAK